MKNHFTLVEVLVALAILALGILAGTQLLFSARERCRIAQAQWSEQHAMTQAAEYFLLAGCDQNIPERFFPFAEYRINAWYEPPSQLPSDVPARLKTWQLSAMRLQLLDAERKTLRELSIDRIVPTGEKTP